MTTRGAMLLVLLVVMLATCVMGQVGNCHAFPFVTESIPEELPLTPQTSYTNEAWKELIRNAKSTLLFGAYYWTLGEGSQYPPVYAGWKGAEIFELIKDAAVNRSVRIKILQNAPDVGFPDLDSAWLAEHAGAEVVSINFSSLGIKTIASGIFHTKVIVADNRDVYVGSANMDWRSLSQVKETGVVLQNCPEMARDATKIVEAFVLASQLGRVPLKWPAALHTKYNHTHPMMVKMPDGTVSPMYMAVSPIELCADGRSDATASTVAEIAKATHTLSLEVMDYAPTTFYMYPNFYWPVIDDSIRSAAFRGVKVRLLFSQWNHTRASQWQWAKSLMAMSSNIQVRKFSVPNPKTVLPQPFTRVNHSKFMVLDGNTTYITTSNWSADYFLSTGGINVVIAQTKLAQDLQAVFDRDWNSPFSTPI